MLDLLMYGIGFRLIELCGPIVFVLFFIILGIIVWRLPKNETRN